MSLFKDKPTTPHPSNPNNEMLLISPSMFEDGSSTYDIFQDGDTIKIRLVTSKPIAIVGRDEWDAVHEELAKSREYARKLQKIIDDRDKRIKELEDELARWKVDNRALQTRATNAENREAIRSLRIAALEKTLLAIEKKLTPSKKKFPSIFKLIKEIFHDERDT